MSTDSRAYAWCSLGPLEAGSSIADSHAQGSGLITTRGTINISGVIRPAPGSVVELAYSDGQNWIARIPRRLRVLSSFANPLSGKTTAVSVGCDLTYFDDRKQPPTSLTTRQANPDTPEAVWRAAAPAIPASWLVEQILSALGLTAAGAIPLTNHFTRQEFDFTAGYVEELGKLCQSEGYLARMNAAGLVEFIRKDQSLGTAPVITEEDLIDLNPINTGDLPGDSVYAKYTSLKLKKPDDPSDDDLKKRNWEKEEVLGSIQFHRHTYTEYVTTLKVDANGDPVMRQKRDARGFLLYGVDPADGVPDPNFKIMENVYETKSYQRSEAINFLSKTIVLSTYDNRDRVIKRRTETLGLWGLEYSETFFNYRQTYETTASPVVQQSNSDSEVLSEITDEWSSLASMKMSVGYQLPYGLLRGSGTGNIYKSSRKETYYEKDKASGITKTTTRQFVPYMNTPHGSETISRMREAADERGQSAQEQSYLLDVLNRATQLVEYGSEVRIRTEREFGLQKRPSEAQRTASANQKAPTVETTANSIWAVGSATSQTQVELSPPYVPDDRIVRTAGGGWGVIKSDADQKALAYATIENRLLLGHRNGVGLQLLPEMLPPEPLGLVFLRLNGATAAFKVNGTTFNLDPQGVTATTDALFWGAIDGAVADAWFPLPPNASSLPAPVAITINSSPRPANAINIPSGFNPQAPDLAGLFASLPTDQAPTYQRTATPGVLVKPYHETITVQAGAGSGVIVTTQPWIPQTVQQLAGSGAGAISVGDRALAGGGGGVIAQGVPAKTLLAGGGAGVITSAVAATAALVGGGAGVIATSDAPAVAPVPMFSFTGGTAVEGSSIAAPAAFGFRFTLASAKTIKAVGIYDVGANGLINDHELVLGNDQTNWYDAFINSDDSTLISFDAAGTTKYQSLQAGTSLPLDNGWRRLDIASGRTLAAGTYVLLGYSTQGIGDQLIKAATGFNSVSDVSFVINLWTNGESGFNTVSGNGYAYFGPILFF